MASENGITTESGVEQKLISIDDIRIDSRFYDKLSVGGKARAPHIIILLRTDGIDLQMTDFETIAPEDTVSSYYGQINNIFFIVVPSAGVSRGLIPTDLIDEDRPGFAQIAFVG